MFGIGIAVAVKYGKYTVMLVKNVKVRRWLWGLCGSLTICVMCGCHGPKQMEFAEVQLEGCLDRKAESPGNSVFLAIGESVRIEDLRVVNELARFFPGAGSGRKAFWAIGAAPNMQLRFTRSDHSTITVYTKYYRYWGSDVDRGDLDVKGDLQSYLTALFTSVRLLNATATQPKE